MSTSRDNLPAVEEPKDKPPTVVESIWAAARWLASRELLLRIAATAAMLVAGGATVVWAQQQRDAGVAPVKADIAELRQEVAEQAKADAQLHAKQAVEREEDRAQIATVKMQSAEVMLNMRLVVERLNMKPIILVEQPKDGGQ